MDLQEVLLALSKTIGKCAADTDHWPDWIKEGHVGNINITVDKTVKGKINTVVRINSKQRWPKGGPFIMTFLQ